MKKLVLAALMAGALVGSSFVTYAQEAEPKKEEKKEDVKKDEEKKDEKKEGEVDYLKCYRTKGNTWTYKSTSKFSGTETVMYMKYEVTEVTEDKASVKVTMLDKDKKENEYMPPTTTEYDLKPAKVEGDAAPDVKTPEVKTTTETIKVEAGEFECTKYETEMAGNKTTSWMIKANPSIMAKVETKSEYGESTMELVEFKVS
jgi:hypothetical protein